MFLGLPDPDPQHCKNWTFCVQDVLYLGHSITGRLVTGRLVTGRLVTGRLVTGRFVTGRYVTGRFLGVPVF